MSEKIAVKGVAVEGVGALAVPTAPKFYEGYLRCVAEKIVAESQRLEEKHLEQVVAKARSLGWMTMPATMTTINDINTAADLHEEIRQAFLEATDEPTIIEPHKPQE